MKNFISAFLLLLVQIAGAADDPVPQFPWSSKVGDKIQEILRLKMESMTWQYTRSPDGRLGKKSSAALEELADLLAAEKLGMADVPKEGTSIEAKIATWALDRKNRKQAYEDIAFYYCNRPKVEKWGLFYAKFREDPAEKKLAIETNFARFAGRLGPEPERILPEDLREELRLPLEASYFLPPSGDRFTGPLEPLWRSCLSLGLLALGSENSIVVFTSDLKCSIKAFKEGEFPVHEEHAEFFEPARSFTVENSLYSVVSLAKRPSLTALSSLAELHQIPDFLKSIDQGFASAFFVDFPEDQEKHRAIYHAWQKLAAIPHASETEANFADYIKKLVPPVYKEPTLD